MQIPTSPFSGGQHCRRRNGPGRQSSQAAAMVDPKGLDAGRRHRQSAEEFSGNVLTANGKLENHEATESQELAGCSIEAPWAARFDSCGKLRTCPGRGQCLDRLYQGPLQVPAKTGNVSVRATPRRGVEVRQSPFRRWSVTRKTAAIKETLAGPKRTACPRQPRAERLKMGGRALARDS